MMMFRNGNSVEVLRREHDPCGLWFPGKIISAVGTDYIVKYKFLMDNEGEPVSEKVHGEDVRPLPRHETGERWKVGDIAEVFDNQCWRVGKVAKVLRKNLFVFRLFGSIQLKEFHESSIRIRKSWHNNKWSVIGKVARDKRSVPSLSIKRCLADHSETNSRNLLITRSHKKRKTSSFVGGIDGFLMGTAPLPKQVVDVSSPRVRLYNENTGKSRDWNHICSTPLWCNEDSNQCSVASCSSDDFAYCPGENTHNNSDAESSFPALCGKKHIFPSPRKKLEVGIHELELRAYESTVQALYASGPLSWEQESLLTNLRLSLNISDEEHLLQLRHLLSAQIV